MKTKCKVLLVGVSPVEKFKDTNVCEIGVIEPGYSDEFGEKKGKDQTHYVRVLNRNIDKLPAAVLEKITNGQEVRIEPPAKCELTCYVNSREFEYQGKNIKSTELVLADITFM